MISGSEWMLLDLRKLIFLSDSLKSHDCRGSMRASIEKAETKTLQLSLKIFEGLNTYVRPVRTHVQSI